MSITDVAAPLTWAQLGCQSDMTQVPMLWNLDQTAFYVNKRNIGLASYGPIRCTNPMAPIWNPNLGVTFNNPGNDGAWWTAGYSFGNYPRVEAENFAGFIPNEITGLYSTPWQRQIERTGKGSKYAGQATGIGRTERIITVTGSLIGSTCCGVAFGLRALSARLRGQCTGGCGQNQCAGMKLRLPLCSPVYIGNPSTGVSVESSQSPYRTLYGVHLLSGPDMLDASGPSCGGCGCGPDTEVRFTLAATIPELYDDPAPALYNLPIWGVDTDPCTWCDDETCPSGPTIFDPLCSTIPLPPVAPVLTGCGAPCKPLREVVRWAQLTNKSCCIEQQGILTIDNPGPVRNLRIEFYADQGGISPLVNPNAYRCKAYSGIAFGYLPAGRTVFDSRDGTTIVTPTGGVPTPASNLAYGVDSLPFSGSLPIPCGTSWVRVTADQADTPVGTVISVQTVNAEL
jgi:hypothetical protein